MATAVLDRATTKPSRIDSDSENPSSAQTAWFRDQVATPEVQNATWRIALFHHPVYPCNYKSPFDEGLDWIH